MKKYEIDVMNMPAERVQTLLYTDYLIIEKNTVHSDKVNNIHTHSFYELEIVVSGEIESRINNKSSKAVKADFWLSLPNDFHTLLPLSDETVLISVKFTDNILSHSMRDYLNLLQESIFGSLPEADFNKCKEMFGMIIENYRKITSEFNKEIYVKSALEMMLSYFMNYCTGFLGCMSESMSENGKIFDSVDYIKKNFKSQITINDISSRFHYTPSYFSSKFKSTIGCSVIDFINNERLRHAYYLLKTSEMPVNEVACFVGFNSPSYFSKLFKRAYGIAPFYVKRSDS